MTNPLPIALSTLLAIASTNAFAESPTEFLKQYCIRCHGPEKQQADRRFDALTSEIATHDDLELWQEILDQLNLGEMPPKDAPQPTQAERLDMVETLTDSITAANSRLKGAAGHTVMRRLNAVEYRYTIGDLLGLNVDGWNPAANFPPEVKARGFDNNGEALVTSGMLLDHYLLAAEEAVRRATQFEPRPERLLHTQKSPFYFDGKAKGDLPKLFHVDRFRYIPDVPYTDLVGRHYRGGHIGFLPLARGGASATGEYTVRVQAATVDRTHPYGDAIDDFRNGDPLVLELAAVNREGSVESTGNVSTERSLALVELTSDQPQWLEWTVHLERGEEPEVRFRNGTTAAKRLTRLILNTADRFTELKPFVNMKPGTERSHGVLKAYRGPKLRIWEVQVEGPHVKTWPPRGHKLLYGDLTPDEMNRETIRQRLQVFAQAAFRRPLWDGELEPVEKLVATKLEEGLEPLAALQLGFQTILCSPGFLYLDESTGPLDDFALASRLSYCLWSSMPDDELLALAVKRTLHHPSTLRRQAERMLADSKSERFVGNFIRVWLNTDSIGEMPPSPDFKHYFRDNLETAMRAETEMFFRHILEHNRPPREFLAADYAFLNRELAEHYGLPPVEGGELRRVALPDGVRGGLLGQGLFLTASANGVDTSPVVRGVYVQEKLLGYTPPPPPPDVPILEPDIRGATTIREQLAKHREIATCAACHRKIDPYGFALENFDAIGGWRNQYPGKTAIDASGELPSGESFTGPADFRRLLVERDEQFTRCLTEKLLTYATGRELTFRDRAEIERIVQESSADGRGFRDLVLLVLSSSTLQNR